MHKKWLRRICLHPYILTNNFQKTAFFSDMRNLAIGKISISGKNVYKIFYDQLAF
jgi:hypothetical protein